MQGLLGKKLGMTQVFDEKGHRVGVTVIEVGPCVVLEMRNNGGGSNVAQVGFGEQKEQRVTKAAMGRFKRADTGAKRHLREFAVDDGEEVKAGDTLTASVFDGVTHVDIVGLTKGRGFQGAVKRHGMKGGRMTHGGHSKRRIGAIGQCAYPARVAKGKRMPGHMGHVRITVQNLRVVEVRGEENLVLVRGAVPGPNGSIISVKKALKKSGGPK